jgi:hypothetical protein
MIEIAHASINNFALEATKADFPAQPPDQLIALTYCQLEELVSRAVEKATEPLNVELEKLRILVTKQEKKNELFNSRLQGFSEIQDKQDERIDGHANAINAILQAVKTSAVPNRGKTATRIEELRRILKGRGGSQTFEALQEVLNLTPSQFSKLVSQLDKRSFEVGRRPGSKRGEKVLSLKVKIKEII